MTAHYCVDYLSHEWASDDLIRTYHETCKQYRKHHAHLISSNILEVEQKKIQREQHKIQRLQNALWREMARKCTDKLSQPNHYIDPSAVSWQKESDITWLFGPMYSSVENQDLNKKNFPTSPQNLRPILKKKSNVTQWIPGCSDRNVKNASDHPSWFKYTSQSGTKSSPKEENPIGVTFHPEIVEIQYQPDSPIFPLEDNSDDDDDDDDESDYDEEEDDDELWSLFVHATLEIKQSAISQISFFTHYIQTPRTFLFKKQSASKELIRHNGHAGSLELFILLVSVVKSVFSFTTTWIIYQSLSPFSWITKPLFQPRNTSNTAGQYNKSRLIL